MTQYKDVLTMQYMGSKSRLLNEICSSICERSDISTVIDLFAGSGTIGYALKPYKKIISNDLEYYSYILNEAILNGCYALPETLECLWKKADDIVTEIELYVKDAIDLESKFFQKDSIDVEAYNNFCESTPSVFNKTEAY